MFLVSKKNNYITGQNIVVDGGFSIIKNLKLNQRLIFMKYFLLRIQKVYFLKLQQMIFLLWTHILTKLC